MLDYAQQWHLVLLIFASSQVLMPVHKVCTAACKTE
jgi:hypothetical protein